MATILSTDAILRELAYISKNNTNTIEALEEMNEVLQPITEEQYNKVIEHLRLDIVNPDKFVEVNNCQPISNPRAFDRDSIPSDDGLLSNKIFGITKDERAGIFGYIDLQGTFIDPSCYKAWIRIDSKVKDCVHGIGFYRVNDRGEIVEDPQGRTGINFLKQNINKIKFKSTDSIRRDIKVQYLNQNRDKMFITKYLVIPPYYRDKNTGSRAVGLGGINKLYNNLIVACNALTATRDYLFDASNAMKGRVQELILCIYDWFCGNNNPNINTDTGAGMSGKFGIIKRANMSKTADFSSRLVISACELKTEKPEDMMVNIDRSAIPLSACIANFRDFILFHTKRFFENEFQGSESYPTMDDSGKVTYYPLDSPELAFSDERIKLEMERYLHGYNNRFVPIEVPLSGTKTKYYMQFKGRNVDPESGKIDPLTGDIQYSAKEVDPALNRKLTWCDVFYIAAVEATRDKQILITRFPIDSFANQITTGIVVSSTEETEPMLINGTYYPFYPKIRAKDIGANTSNRFVDTMQFSNIYLKAMDGDFDGDQITVKGVYTEEANEELRNFRENSKQSLISFGCRPLRVIVADSVQAIYALTKVLYADKDKITKSDKITFV